MFMEFPRSQQEVDSVVYFMSWLVWRLFCNITELHVSKINLCPNYCMRYDIMCLSEATETNQNDAFWGGNE
jgi:hypothetical protein